MKKTYLQPQQETNAFSPQMLCLSSDPDTGISSGGDASDHGIGEGDAKQRNAWEEQGLW